MISKAELLDAAKEAVAGRGLNYGRLEDNFQRIANRWNVHLRNAYGIAIEISPASVAIMCADIKIARLENQPAHLDSWIDLAGYAACGAEIAT